MMEMMDKSKESADEDAEESVRDLGKTNGAVKETLGLVKSFRRSIRKVVDRKGAKVTTKGDTDGDESQPPPSPSLSAGSLAKSPLKHFGSLFQKKPEAEADVTQQKGRPLKRSQTDPTFKRVPSTQSQKQEQENVEEELAEPEETYTLQEIPQTPLSVMQISKMIETDMLEEAHINLLALRREFQRDQDSCGGGDSPVELIKREKDLNLLYRDLRNKICSIVRDSSNKALLLPLARIIQEEEKRAGEPGGLPGGWMEAWREAVGEGVRQKVEGVRLERREQKDSWLAEHLVQLGQAVVEDLKGVKQELRWSYPPSFRVFSTHVESFNRGVGQHLKNLEPKATELRDLHLLLDWILNTYSQCIMGNPSLQPEIKDEWTELQLEESFVRQLKEKYYSRVNEDVKMSLNRIIELEITEVWKEKNKPEMEDNLLMSHIHMDIWREVEGKCCGARAIDVQLEQKVITSCLEELNRFPERFHVEFIRHCQALRPQDTWTEYQITYINTFTALEQHMDNYQTSCPDQVEGFRGEVKQLILRLLKDLEDQFRSEVQPYLRRMMTRKWLTNDSDFSELHRRIERLSEHSAHMRPPHVQEFASRLHYHVVKEYLGQLMKNNYTCKNRKHEKAAAKIQDQWRKLSDAFVEMESTHQWLYPAGEHLGKIIGEKSNVDIRKHIAPLVNHYPDFSRNHLVAVLNFRGLVRGHEQYPILQQFKEVKKRLGGGNRGQVLFGDMQVVVNRDCLPNVPSFCYKFLLRNNQS